MYFSYARNLGAATLCCIFLVAASASAQVFPVVGGGRSLGLKDSIYMVIRDDDAPALDQSRIDVIREAELAMRDFYATGSGGQFDMQFTHILDVPLALNSNGTRPNDWRNLALDYVRNTYSLEPEDFDSNIYDVNATATSPGQAWTGIYYGNSNDFAIQINIDSNSGRMVFNHELGHRIGADHANAFRAIDNSRFTPYVWNQNAQQYEVYDTSIHGNVATPYGVRRDEYGNPFDTMGNVVTDSAGNVNLGDFRVREKLDDLDWLTDAQVPDLSALGEGTYRLYAHNELELTMSTDPDPVYGVVETYDPNAYYGLTFERTAERFNDNTRVFENYTQQIDLEYRVNDFDGTGRDGVQFYLDGSILDLDLEGGLTRNNLERELEVGQSIQDIDFAMSLWDAGENGDGDFLSYSPPAPSDPLALRSEWFNFDVLSTGIDEVGSYIELAVSTQQFSSDKLVWNQATGNFGVGFARGNALQEVAANGVDPFGDNGTNHLYLANGGTATLDDTTDMTSGMIVASMRIGTDQASGLIADRNGFGVLDVNDSVSLTIGNGQTEVGEIGNLTVAEGGYEGTLTWNSTGTLNVEGRLRVGQSGRGTMIQNAGTVIAGNSSVSEKFVAVGNGPGSDASSYTLNNGSLLVGGGLAGSQMQDMRIGSNAVANFILGDDAGEAGTAVVETRGNFYVGHNSGTGSLTIMSDGEILQSGEGAAFVIGDSGAAGNVVQSGGSYQGEQLVSIGSGANSVGHYSISGGLMNVASNNGGALLIGENGGQGTLQVEGTANVIAGAELVIAATDNSASVGVLQILGSNASISIGKLGNALATDEKLFWEADADGIAPLLVRGDHGSSLFVELQHPAEIASNVGGVGDGIALELDLAAIEATDKVLTLIDNQSVEPILGFFEDPLSTGDLYEEGEEIFETGFAGLVTISYFGGDGNDVVLYLSTEPSTPSGDFDGDFDVDGTDFLVWQRGLDALYDTDDFVDWQTNFETFNEPATNVALVPEPSSFWLLMCPTILIGLVGVDRRLQAAVELNPA